MNPRTWWQRLAVIIAAILVRPLEWFVKQLPAEPTPPSSSDGITKLFTVLLSSPLRTEGTTATDEPTESTDRQLNLTFPFIATSSNGEQMLGYTFSPQLLTSDLPTSSAKWEYRLLNSPPVASRIWRC